MDNRRLAGQMWFSSVIVQTMGSCSWPGGFGGPQCTNSACRTLIGRTYEVPCDGETCPLDPDDLKNDWFIWTDACPPGSGGQQYRTACLVKLDPNAITTCA